MYMFQAWEGLRCAGEDCLGHRCAFVLRKNHSYVFFCVAATAINLDMSSSCIGVSERREIDTIPGPEVHSCPAECWWLDTIRFVERVLVQSTHAMEPDVTRD